MRLGAALLLLLALPALGQEQPPFLMTVTDPTNSHFAKETLAKDLPAAIKQKLSAHAELTRVVFGPEVDSLAAARDYAGKERARFYVFAQCGLVIELLKQCDAHIKFCAHSCEAFLFQTDGGKQLGHAKVTGEKGGTDAVKKLIGQVQPLLEALQDPIEQLLQQQKAEREAKLQSERLQKQLAQAEKDRKLAEERARKATEAEEKKRIAEAEAQLKKARTEQERREAQARLEAERAAQKAKTEDEKRAAREKAAQAQAQFEAEKDAQKARLAEEALRKEAEAARKKLDAEREKRVALERAQASRVIHLVPGQTVAVLEVENDLQGGARNQVNFGLLTDNLRKRVSKSGLGLLVMDREAIFSILSANEKKVLECQANCETQLGQILKADYVISGRLGKQGAAFRMYLLMYRSKDGALLSDATATSPDLGTLDKGAAIASTDLLSVFPMAR